MRDNQPKHRQLRRAGRRLERRKATRAGMAAVLILCEGRETEPNYLYGYCDANGINRANVTVVPGDGRTSAMQLIKRARQRFEIDRDFDAVFVVCDCAGESLAEARGLAAAPMKSASGAMVSVRLIVSQPCFEFWLLLHFEYMTRPLPTPSAAIDLLRRHVTDYDKADRQIFGKVQVGLDRALGNVRRLKAELAAVGAQTPDTDMPELIGRLDSLRRRLPPR